jgi:hypothetical protein
MTPTDYAAHELALWEQARRAEMHAQEQFQASYHAGATARTRHLLQQLQSCRTTSALLLAQAVKVKCAFRDRSEAETDESTWPSDLRDAGEPQ